MALVLPSWKVTLRVELDASGKISDIWCETHENVGLLSGSDAPWELRSSHGWHSASWLDADVLAALQAVCEDELPLMLPLLVRDVEAPF